MKRLAALFSVFALVFTALVVGCTPSSRPAPTPKPSPAAPSASAPESASAPTSQPASAAATQKAPFVPRSWCLYYGSPCDGLVDRLAGHDLVVVDPAALGEKAPEIVAALHLRGCRVVGYLSAVEIATWHDYRDRIDPSWYIVVDDKPWIPWAGTAVGWRTNLAASLAAPGWRDLLAELVDRTLSRDGCDGVFFDTLEDLDFPNLPSDEAARQREGLQLLFHALREAHPDALLLTNRTLGATLDVVAEDGDGICWEDFAVKFFEDPNTRTWMEGVAARIEDCRARRAPDRPFHVLALWNGSTDMPDFAAAREAVHRKAEAYGYVPYCTRGGYSALPPD